ncbi:hypothetical protein [Neisseria iguanae]|uniref:Uncharacterized protein n=1 Tax=Neisseria iguanae TaxID=90242 RepID=A0A2P7U121_9NEIS|nr:hypothetical protein [Neisseria iguanae]PSJ80659.1 hypothetical protein C7N83_05095 [Neisseria iguanae]
MALKQNGFSQKQIQQFLAENGLSVGLTTINWFLRTRSKDIDSSKTKSQKKANFINKLNNKSEITTKVTEFVLPTQKNSNRGI